MQRHETAYRQDRTGQGWDGYWHLVAFAIPENRRPARDRLRDCLIDHGGAAINNGMYVSPHSWEDTVRTVADDLGVADRLTLATTWLNTPASMALNAVLSVIMSGLGGGVIAVVQGRLGATAPQASA